MVVGERWYVGGTAANSGSRSAVVVVHPAVEVRRGGTGVSPVGWSRISGGPAVVDGW